jgi:glycosyltransferase involved in cell wall biosynthesis
LGLTEPAKTTVLASGSCDGVEVEKFLPTPKNLARSEQIRNGLDLPKDVPVIGFVGRFTRDKGIPELLEAYDKLRCEYPTLRLLLVGHFEDGDPVPPSLRLRIENDTSIVRPGFVADTSPYYHLMHVLVLPTHREGFPDVPLEAQAAGKPVVTTRATGAIDSVLDDETGLLVPVGDAAALTQAIGSLLADPARREEMGRKGQEWVSIEFTNARVRSALVREYRSAIRERLHPDGR